MKYITVIPAYGRDYKTAKAARADWNANKDFAETFSRSYITKEEADKEGLRVTIRFDDLRKICSAT